MPVTIAVSACLLGRPCRYDGAAYPCDEVISLDGVCKLVPICPEVEGGLPTPRRPCEIDLSRRDLLVRDVDGLDRTRAFLAGAQKSLEMAKATGCSLAVLKAKSPSCGSGRVYDGTFSGTLAAGYGVAARLFRSEGIRVVDESLVREMLAACEALPPDSVPPIFAASSAECPALETERLLLRPLVACDEKEVLVYCNDSDAGNDASWLSCYFMEDARVFMEQPAFAPHVFGVFEKASATRSVCAASSCVGLIGLAPDSRRRNPDCLMLGYALTKRAGGQGYATEALREMVRYGFEDLRIPLISCAHYSSNESLRCVIEKCGFRCEGILHDAEASPDGIARDIVLHVLAAEEWRALRP